MSKKIITAVRWTAVFFVSTSSALVSAQAVVRDSRPVTTVTTPVATANTPAQPNLAYQIQQLQQEILELRGLVEEQGFEIKRLKQQRLDDYLDLDKRLQQLSKAQTQLPVAVEEQPISPEASSDLPEIQKDDGKALYSQAIDQLLSQQDYAGAKTSFNQYLTQYPEGPYAPNVYYWVGQIQLSEGSQAQAIESFKTLIDTYPAHQKVPDAKYKLATVLFNSGKKAEAKSLLQEVANTDTDAARLAKAFLSKQFN